MILKVKDLRFKFQEEKNLLNGATFTLNAGNIYALMGANGSGKTTVFNIISGFIKPQHGQIYFKERDVLKLFPYQIARIGIGRTFQDLRLISRLSVQENILLAMQNNPTDDWLRALLPESFYKESKKVLTEKTEQILDEYYLIEVKNSFANEISYGQQKLLNLACCVANNAEMLLLDEPLAGVNEEYQELLQSKIYSLRELGKTIIIIDHNTDFLARAASTFFFLLDGDILIFESFEAMKSDLRVIESYIK